jgi:hypothetical protein
VHDSALLVEAPTEVPGLFRALLIDVVEPRRGPTLEC